MRPRTFGYDHAYGIEHRERFPEQYERLEHRFASADIDWTEFCGYSRCRRPLILIEMYRDTERGQDLNDKSATVTGRLARGVCVPAYVIGVWVRRPREVQDQIDALNAQVLELTRQYPITRIRAQLRVPHRGPVVAYEPGKWWELIALHHSWHHAECPEARRSGEVLASPEWLRATARRHPGLWVPPQPPLTERTG